MARGVLPCLEGILPGKAHGGSSPSCPLPLRLHTCPNDLLDLDICRIHLPGKFSDGLAGVLVRGRVDVILHPKPCCRQMGYMLRVRYEARLPTHPRHALLQRQAEEHPRTLGEPSLACCAQPPASLPHTWTAVLLELLCVACPTPLPEDKPEPWNDTPISSLRPPCRPLSSQASVD